MRPIAVASGSHRLAGDPAMFRHRDKGREPPGCDWRQAQQLTAVYLGLDRDHRVGYCGQCVRELGVGRRIREHLRHAGKRPLFASFVVVELHDLTPYEVVDAIEGRIADLLSLRGIVRGRRWPSANAWARLVSSQEAHARAGEVAGVRCYAPCFEAV